MSSTLSAPKRRDPRAFHPFLRLNTLLEGLKPGPVPEGLDGPLNLSIGDPKLPAPAMVAEEIAKHPDSWSSYPPFQGPLSYREACKTWLDRRYKLPKDMVSVEKEILPLPGSREGLFFAAEAAISLKAPEGKDAVLMPAPAYHVYVGGAVACGAEMVFAPANKHNGFLPDFDEIAPKVLDKVAIAFICAPSNPEGAAADKARWQKLIATARRHNFFLAADECYADLWLDEPTCGALEAAADMGEGHRCVVSFNSLSKRNSAAGLRCGFAAGDPDLVGAIDALFRYGGAGVQVPVLHAGARLWSDQDHAEETRQYYVKLFDLAEEILDGRFDWKRPAGGFFLWLDVGDGEAAAVKLWTEAGLKVLPGGYMCPEEGVDMTAKRYIRVPLVYSPEITAATLKAIVQIL